MANLIRYFWKNLYESVRDYREKKCEEYCVICGDNCCNGRLNPSFRHTGVFSHLKRVRYRWHSPPVNEPYLIDRRFLFFGNLFLVNACPYLKDNLCIIHDAPERPLQCLEYPLYLDCPLGIPFLRPFISVEMSCRIFRYKKNISEIEMFAKKLNLQLVFHQADDGNTAARDPSHGTS